MWRLDCLHAAISKSLGLGDPEYWARHEARQHVYQWPSGVPPVGVYRWEPTQSPLDPGAPVGLNAEPEWLREVMAEIKKSRPVNVYLTMWQTYGEMAVSLQRFAAVSRAYHHTARIFGAFPRLTHGQGRQAQIQGMPEAQLPWEQTFILYPTKWDMCVVQGQSPPETPAAPPNTPTPPDYRDGIGRDPPEVGPPGKWQGVYKPGFGPKNGSHRMPKVDRTFMARMDREGSPKGQEADDFHNRPLHHHYFQSISHALDVPARELRHRPEIMPHWVYRSGEDTLTIPRALAKGKAVAPPPPRTTRPVGRVPSEELTQSEHGDRAESEERRRDELREHDFQQGVASGRYGADWVWTQAWTDAAGRPRKKAWKENPNFGNLQRGLVYRESTQN